MGIDATMAVATVETPEKLNMRFRKTHSCHDSLINESECLIEYSMDIPANTVNYGNVYKVNCGLARYYGIGYERGPAMRIILQLEWLRAQPEVLAVFYGGDEYGPQPWTEEDSMRLMKHFFAHGNARYAKWCEGTWK